MHGWWSVRESTVSAEVLYNVHSWIVRWRGVVRAVSSCSRFAFNCDSCVTWTPLPCSNHLDYEIFTPPYLLDENMNSVARPEIKSASDSAALGGTLTAETSVPCTFTLVRLGAVTHTINNDARRIPLPIDASDGTVYTLRLPSNPNVALPGLYWLYALNEGGAPSEGYTVELLI